MQTHLLILFIKSTLFSVVVPGTIGILIPTFIADNALIITGITHWFSIIFLIIGLSIYCWCVWDFIMVGLGTPAPIAAPKHLVVKGLYHYTRNPMYVGVSFAILGWALFYGSLLILIYSLCMIACFQLLIIYYEEPKLQKLFGHTYETYKITVNRWLPTLF